MPDILFELESENWSGLYDLSVDQLKSEPDNEFLWYCRAVACIGLTTEENDKSKESVTSIKKFSEKSDSNESYDSKPFCKAIESRIGYWHQQLMRARQGEMAKDKPDNINYGLQMMAGDLAQNAYAATHSEKIKNILEASSILATKLEGNKDALIELLEINRRLVKIGFDKSLGEKNVEQLKSYIIQIRQYVKKIDPEYSSPSSSSGCLVLIIAITAAALAVQFM